LGDAHDATHGLVVHAHKTICLSHSYT
jgi:hypothetical protein